MDIGQALDILGQLVASLKHYASKLPAMVPLAAVPGGIKPAPEAVDAYEGAVSRFRDLSRNSVFKTFHGLLLESLEAFEAGKLLGAIQPLLAILDQLDVMMRERQVIVSPTEQKRVGEYRAALHKILPGNKPELDTAGKKP